MSHILRCEYELKSVKYRLSVGDLSEMKGWSVQKIYLHLRLIGRLGNEGGKIRWDFTLTPCHYITGFLKLYIWKLNLNKIYSTSFWIQQDKIYKYTLYCDMVNLWSSRTRSTEISQDLLIWPELTFSFFIWHKCHLTFDIWHLSDDDFPFEWW